MTLPTPEAMSVRYQSALRQMASCHELATGSEHDLYRVADELIAWLEANLPPFACRVDCHNCCSTPPLISFVEWQALYPTLLALPEETKRTIVTMALRQRPLASILAGMRQAALSPVPVAAPDALIQCPLLIEGGCSVYGARPLMCRVFGYTYLEQPDRFQAGTPTFFGCQLAYAQLQVNLPQDGSVSFPAIDAYFQRIDTLNVAARGTKAYILQWLWAQIDDGHLVSAVRSEPRLD